MQTITRHGGGSHFVRPDRVYRTGVLTSTMGYDPGADVQDVMASFTAYPMDLQAPGLSGLGFGATNLPWLTRMRLRYEAWKARRAARLRAQGRGTAMRPEPSLPPGQMAGFGYAFQEGFRGLGLARDMDARDRGVAYPQIGMQIAPAQVGKHEMAMELIHGGVQHGFARAQAGKSWNYWWNQRWNG